MAEQLKRQLSIIPRSIQTAGSLRRSKADYLREGPRRLAPRAVRGCVSTLAAFASEAACCVRTRQGTHEGRLYERERVTPACALGSVSAPSCLRITLSFQRMPPAQTRPSSGLADGERDGKTSGGDRHSAAGRRLLRLRAAAQARRGSPRRPHPRPACPHREQSPRLGVPHRPRREGGRTHAGVGTRSKLRVNRCPSAPVLVEMGSDHATGRLSPCPPEAKIGCHKSPQHLAPADETQSTGFTSMHRMGHPRTVLQTEKHSLFCHQTTLPSLRTIRFLIHTDRCTNQCARWPV